MGTLMGIAWRERSRAVMQTRGSADITPESGVANDFRGKPGNRQVTVLSARAWRAACEEVGRKLDWTARRANLLVDDFDLPTEKGGVLQIGTVRLRINRETDPCSRMDEQCPGLRKALQPDWRGGVCCSVLQGGTVSIGDPVSLTTAT